MVSTEKSKCADFNVNMDAIVTISDSKDDFSEVNEQTTQDTQIKSILKKVERDPRSTFQTTLSPDISDNEEPSVFSTTSGVIFKMSTNRMQQLRNNKTVICIGFGLLIFVLVVMPINITLFTSFMRSTPGE